jgi:hypothetical protein
MLLPFILRGQQPLLQITSPGNGAIVNPGQNLTIGIASPAGAAFAQVDVIGQNPIGSSDVATSVPAQFTISIPSDIALGKYLLTAEGTTVGGQDAKSTSVTVDVERADLPIGISPSMSTIAFATPTQTTPLPIFATFSDGTVLDASRSSYLTYTSSNIQVVTVDGNGIVTAVCAGTSSISATYTLGANSVQTSIPAQGPPSLAAFPSALGFNVQNVGTSSSSQTITLINASNSLVNILGVTTSSDFSQTNSCGSLQPGATCSINVAFVPTAVGVRSGTVNVADDSCLATLQMSLTGTGMSDFSVSATPATQTVTVGGSTSYTVSVTSLGGFSNAITFGAAGLPSGASASFNPTSISGGSGSSSLNVNSSSKTPTGTYTLTITGTSGSLAHSKTVTLTVNPRH